MIKKRNKMRLLLSLFVRSRYSHSCLFVDFHLLDVVGPMFFYFDNPFIYYQ
jgi:hypothetical protein